MNPIASISSSSAMLADGMSSQAAMSAQNRGVGPGLSAPKCERGATSHTDAVQELEPGEILSDCDDDNVIIFGTGTLSPWLSDNDTQELVESEVGSPQAEEQPSEEDLEKAAVAEIQMDGMDLPIQGWIRKEVVQTVQVLTDKFLRNWSGLDRKCRLHEHRFPTISRWTQAIKTHEVQLVLPITVVAIQCIRQIECLEPLKNRLSSLCRAIRYANPSGGRIFIATNIANPRAAPVLGKRAKEHNILLMDAVGSVNKQLGRVFLCDVASHLWHNNEYIQPVSAYFNMDGDLTVQGCFVYRACLFREIGIAPYHI